jgi:ribose-phosphate pyrophosphokinase
MIRINENDVNVNKFPDGTLLLKELISEDCGQEERKRKATITWLFENNEELVTLIYLAGHLRAHGVAELSLDMPYIPNARQDRVKAAEDVFTLKYFAEVINWLNFDSVTVLDPHSSVSEALIDKILVRTPEPFIQKVINKIGGEKELTMFYPDEGACKRYSGMFRLPYAFGIKNRDWETGDIRGLDVSGMTDCIRDRKILIVDDISSKGGTFYFSAKKLKELGAGEIYLYISHCENTILEGDVLTSGLIKRVFTTNSIFTKKDERIEVFDYE